MNEGFRWTLRHDYLELTELALILLGGTLPDGITFRAPGTTHHARWMAEMMYTFKITLFRKQLSDVFEEDSLDFIEELGDYLALLYVQYWLCCTSTADTPVPSPSESVWKSAQQQCNKHIQRAGRGQYEVDGSWALVVLKRKTGTSCIFLQSSQWCRKTLCHRSKPRMKQQQQPITDRFRSWLVLLHSRSLSCTEVADLSLWTCQQLGV